MTDTDDSPAVRRRTVLSTVGAAAGVALAGCSGGGGSSDGGDNGGGGGSDNTVAVGPGGDFKFKPEELTVSKGTTVTWEFKSSSHNVCAWPDMHDKVSIPDGASGFGTMDQGGDAYATVSKGETFEHTFETTGEYTYVCMPHAASGMVGTIIVE
ncbi:MAG: plastocyanin/azurin family copper-binding protein [Halobacteriaceae archaeon]